jgi:hypothetical protein
MAENKEIKQAPFKCGASASRFYKSYTRSEKIELNDSKLAQSLINRNT